MLRNHSDDNVKKINAYAEEHTEQPSDYLGQLDRKTHLYTLKPQMMSDAFQGRLLSLLSKLVAPKRILEIGTFTGYGTLCLAEGLQDGGELITIEKNEELIPMLEDTFEGSDWANQIQLMQGDAVDLVGGLTGVFDFIFIDADKSSYKTYLDLCVPLLRTGGLLLLDNVLWDGKVLMEKKDKKTAAIDEVNKLVDAHPDLENILLPIRDGIMVARKK